MPTEYRRPVVIRQDDLIDLTMILSVFDRVVFNTDGEMVGEMDVTLPVVGPVVVSYYHRESHVQVRRKADDKAIINTNIDTLNSRDDLLGLVKELIREEAIKLLTPAVAV
jgi:hypothetical protein